MRRLAVAGAVGLTLLAVAGPGAAAQEGASRPESFAGAASASALEVELVTPSLVPVEDLFDVHVAEGRGTFESDNQEGRASLLLGGNAAVLGPSLLCETFLGPQAPESFRPLLDACADTSYPLAVFVDPLQPDAQTQGATTIGEDGDPFAVRAIGARAHAGTDATTTAAEVGDVRVDALRVDGVTARTDQRFRGDTLVLDARATVTGLTLGVLRIGSIDSRSRAELTPGKAPKVTSSFDVAGVEVAGQRVAVDDQKGLAQALGGTGLRVTVLPKGDGGEVPGTSIGGLELELTAPASGLPPAPGPTGELDLNGDYGLRVVVGATGVRGFAEDLPDLDASFDPPIAAAGPSIGAGGDLPPVAPTAEPAPAAEDQEGPIVADPLSRLVADRLRLLYLAFTLAGLAVCLSPRFTVPARFGSSHA